MLTNGTTPLIETETLDGFAAVSVRDTTPEIRQTAEEIWKRAMESVTAPILSLDSVLTPTPLQENESETNGTVPNSSAPSQLSTAVATATPAPSSDLPFHETVISETIRTRTNLGRLRRVTLSEVWHNDVSSFAEWVQNSLDLLGEAISLTATENADGSLSLPQNAVIECQLGESHNDSLGKLLSEIAKSNAKLAVWVVERPKADHLRVIQWLNQTSTSRFYLVKVDAVRIEESVPAPFYTPIIVPSK